MLRGEAAFGELVEDHLNRSLVLWVYNSEFDVVREVELVPRRGWGGEGALGAVLGYGALHRLPVGLGEEVQGPGEKLFDAERKSDELAYTGSGDGAQYLNTAPPPPTLSPPPMMSPNVPPPMMMSPAAPPTNLAPVTARTKKGRHHGLASPNRAFDDMFAEGAKKSAELDLVPSRKASPLPPPPKAGGPIMRHAVEETHNPMEQEDEGHLGETKVD
jgi:GRASP55/65 PDZ-like domain